jgi:aminoglycoside phosphotransferase (APT) family kinase protein
VNKKPNETPLPKEIDQWLSGIVDGAVTAVTPIAGGGQRKTHFVDVDGGGHNGLVLQISSDGGPYHGKGTTSLAREGATFAALATSPAATIAPEIVGVSPDGNAILTIRAPGESDFDGIEDEARRAALTQSFVEALATLHRVDADIFADAGYAPVGDGPDAARKWVGVWRRLFEDVTRPAPLIRFALQWLDANAPDVDGPIVLCHGDTGPGNFLFEDQKLTKLVDWELSHFGDYHSDLGMLALRGYQLGAMVDLDGALAHYAKVSGRRVDGWKVRYHRALALILGNVTTLSQLDKAVATGQPLVAMPLYLHLAPLLQLWLAEACWIWRALSQNLRPCPRKTPIWSCLTSPSVSTAPGMRLQRLARQAARRTTMMLLRISKPRRGSACL